MGRPAGWMKELTGRSALKSPGRPSHRREVERLFWKQIATGVTSEQAAAAVGVSSAVGTRWFRHRGGMPLHLATDVSSRYLSFFEREEIAVMVAEGKGVREIARTLDRAPSTISRELRRNAATRGGKLEYRASVAQWKSEIFAARPKEAKLVGNEPLREYVQDRLAGRITDSDGAPVDGPEEAKWAGRNKPHRGDRRWVKGWSPEQISNRLKVDFPEDESMRISHEAIYQALYIQGRGALKRELVTCLRTGRALRVPRERTRSATWAHVNDRVLISERPAEAEDRAVPGHWEGDLIVGPGSASAILTLVERSTRYVLLGHLPGGHSAEEVRDVLTALITTLPAHLRGSLTWDQGCEMARHKQFTVATGVPVYFCDPHSPWQRGSNENTNGLLRQYFPKSTDLRPYSPQDLEHVSQELNARPRKTLNWDTPAERLRDLLTTT